MSLGSASQIQYKMQVFTSDAAPVGEVKQIHENDFVVDRERARDIIVPNSFVREVLLEEKRVELAITEAEFDDREWEHPPLL